MTILKETPIKSKRKKNVEIPREPVRRTLEYELFGEKPRALFFGGIHGDEGGVLESLIKVLDERRNYFPILLKNLLRITKPYPEALRAGTRGDRTRKIDDNLNREFPKPESGKKLTHSRAIMLAELLKKFPDLEYVFSFHEDTYHNEKPDYKPQFYMYDIPPEEPEKGKNTVEVVCRYMIGEIKKEFGKEIVKTGRDDEELNIDIKDGYKCTPVDAYNTGDFETYTVALGRKKLNKVKRAFIFEIPTDLSQAEKDRMVEIIFDKFIIPFLESKMGESQ